MFEHKPEGEKIGAETSCLVKEFDDLRVSKRTGNQWASIRLQLLAVCTHLTLRPLLVTSSCWFQGIIFVQATLAQLPENPASVCVKHPS